MRRFLVLCTVALSLVACQTTAPKSQPLHVVIVGTTDVHGWFNGHVDVPEKGADGIHYGGVALLASYVDALRARHGDRVLVVDSGDMFQGTLESNLFEGESVVHGYNAVGYTAAAVGNHEFDYGPLGPPAVPRTPEDDPFGALKRNVQLAKFPFLSANMVEKSTGKVPAWAKPYTIVEIGGAKIGIIGLSTPDTPNVTMRANVLTLDFTDPLEATVRYAAELRAMGADAIVVTAHIGGRCTKDDAPHSLDSCDRQQEAMRYLEAMPPGTIDAFFGGHTHARMRQFVNGVAAAQAAPYSREFSTIDLWIDPARGTVMPERTFIRNHTAICSVVFQGTDQCEPRNAPAKPHLVPRTYEGRRITAKQELVTIFEPYLREVAAKRNEDIGVTTAEPFVRSYTSESPLGNLLTDALRAVTGSDIALFNSGGIRADLRAGKLVYGDIFETSPFDNYPAILTLTGEQVAEAIRLGSSGDRGLFQASGIRYTLDLARDADKPAGERDRLVSITLSDGSPLDPQKLYKVVMPDFVAAGGDGLMPLVQRLPNERIVVFQDRAIREYLVEALEKMPQPLVPKLEQRITVLNGQAPRAK